MKKNISKNWLGNNLQEINSRKTYGVSIPRRNELIKKELFNKEKNIEKTENKNLIIKELKNERNYKIKYAVLDSNKIINLCGPEYLYIPKNSSEEELKKADEFSNSFINFMNKKINFFNNLEKSILEKGILNPILVTTGYPQWFDFKNLKPKHSKIEKKNFLCCELLGGSRLYIAQKHKMLIPAIISDFEDLFPNAVELNENNIINYFENPPNTIKITDKGIRMSTLEQIHLDINQRNYVDILELRRNFFHGY